MKRLPTKNNKVRKMNPKTPTKDMKDKKIEVITNLIQDIKRIKG